MQTLDLVHLSLGPTGSSCYSDVHTQVLSKQLSDWLSERCCGACCCCTLQVLVWARVVRLLPPSSTTSAGARPRSALGCADCSIGLHNHTPNPTSPHTLHIRHDTLHLTPVAVVEHTCSLAVVQVMCGCTMCGCKYNTLTAGTRSSRQQYQAPLCYLLSLYYAYGMVTA
jgi:hypothetical protein